MSYFLKACAIQVVGRLLHPIINKNRGMGRWLSQWSSAMQTELGSPASMKKKKKPGMAAHLCNTSPRWWRQVVPQSSLTSWSSKLVSVSERPCLKGGIESNQGRPLVSTGRQIDVHLNHLHVHLQSQMNTYTHVYMHTNKIKILDVFAYHPWGYLGDR